MFSELFLKEGEATYKDAKGARKVLAHPLFGTVSMVLIGCIPVSYTHLLLAMACVLLYSKLLLTKKCNTI